MMTKVEVLIAALERFPVVRVYCLTGGPVALELFKDREFGTKKAMSIELWSDEVAGQEIGCWDFQ